jgi:hypothetical protein
MPASRGRRVPQRVDGGRTRQQRAHVVRGADPRLGDDGTGTGIEPARGEVVDPLLCTVQRTFLDARFGCAGRVAQVVEQHDGAGREADVITQIGFAEVLVLDVAAAGDRVEPHSVLGHRVELAAVRAGPAIAVAQVDDDRSALESRADAFPGRIG